MQQNWVLSINAYQWNFGKTGTIERMHNLGTFWDRFDYLGLVLFMVVAQLRRCKFIRIWAQSSSIANTVRTRRVIARFEMRWVSVCQSMSIDSMQGRASKMNIKMGLRSYNLMNDFYHTLRMSVTASSVTWKSHSAASPPPTTTIAFNENKYLHNL